MGSKLCIYQTVDNEPQSIRPGTLKTNIVYIDLGLT